ncbi:MAG: transcriptional repressor [Prevotellaceae bacterium]|jgi:Fe2+ or Zn2+ uptake regulation protein|nr:transcriptional repressor [Prevotellaceae bacterium]
MEKQRRNTKTKQQVIAVLHHESGALCHADIVQRLDGKVDRVTVYRILQGFFDEGVVHKISAENGKTYYALCRDCTAGRHTDDHAHFYCFGCKTVSCLEAVNQLPQLPKGYSASDASWFISGYCPNCRAV